MRTLGFLPSRARAGRGGKVPSLEDLCVQSAIDNLQYLGDVGQTDLSLLAKILPHCNADQLHRIETATSGRDLSSVTNELWRKLYASKFGSESMNLVVERMKNKRVMFRWHLLYQAKLKEQEEVQQKGVDRLRQLYKEADMRGSSNQFNHIKGRLMKKSRIEFAASEARIPRSNGQRLPTQVLSQRPVSLPHGVQKSASKFDAGISKSSPAKMMCPRK